MSETGNAELSRVAVVGSTCSGKTAFSRELSALLKVPHTELDALYWEPHWQPRPSAEFRRLVESAVSPGRWIIDGNYGVVRDLIWSRATEVVWLNYAFSRVLMRAFTRTVRRGITREQIFSGNRESLSRSFFSRESILLWVVTSFRRRNREISELRTSKRYPDLSYLEFRAPSETEAFLSLVRAAA